MIEYADKNGHKEIVKFLMSRPEVFLFFFFFLPNKLLPHHWRDHSLLSVVLIMVVVLFCQVLAKLEGRQKDKANQDAVCGPGEDAVCCLVS